ncbi:MAG: serpin family protein [Chloroflexi bacterium]|nr:serpin family protein [Chloroflexota bacterium]
MKKLLLILLTTIMTIGLWGCAQPASAEELKSNKARDTSPVVDTSDLATLVNGNSQFAFDLYQILRKEDGNLFYSPYSISEALAMTYAGARGDTEKNMATAMNFTLPQDRLHPAFNYVDLQLKQRGQSTKGEDEKGFQLNVVNAIWGQQGFSFLAPFLDTLAQNYGAGLRVVDFINETEDSRVTINNWVSEQTANKITDLVPPGSINTGTRLVLTNAVYFNAAWANQFNKSSTTDGTFNLLNGTTVTVPMMHESIDLKYAAGANYQAVELPYDSNQLSMVILLPDSGQFNAFESSLDGQTVKGIVGNLAMTRVNLTMPKFQFQSSFGLKSALSSLGMGVAFTPNADFSGMDGKTDLLIQDVLHKAFVSVDENGTEAAAATGVVVGIVAIPANQADVKIDRPFIFFIRDIPTGSIIFVGRVLDPTAK